MERVGMGRGRHPRTFVEAVTVTVVVCMLELFVVPGHDGFGAFIGGAVAASLAWAVVVGLRVDTDRQPKAVVGEARTRDLVDAVPQWLAVHDLPVEGRTIDHVVITPLAVLAIETTWWGEASPAVHEQRREAAVAKAEQNARTLKRLLAGRDLGFALPVWPVVVAWGPGAEPTQLGRVDVVAGEAADAWKAAYQTGAIHRRLAADAHAALLQYQARADRHEREQHRAA